MCLRVSLTVLMFVEFTCLHCSIISISIHISYCNNIYSISQVHNIYYRCNLTVSRTFGCICTLVVLLMNESTYYFKPVHYWYRPTNRSAATSANTRATAPCAAAAAHGCPRYRRRRRCAPQRAKCAEAAAVAAAWLQQTVAQNAARQRDAEARPIDASQSNWDSADRRRRA